MSAISPRLGRRVERDFGSQAPQVSARLEAIEFEDNADVERVLSAVVLWSRGDRRRLDDAAALAAIDWRDVLVRADLADEDWTIRLDVVLGNPSSRTAATRLDGTSPGVEVRRQLRPYSGSPFRCLVGNDERPISAGDRLEAATGRRLSRGASADERYLPRSALRCRCACRRALGRFWQRVDRGS